MNTSSPPYQPLVQRRNGLEEEEDEEDEDEGEVEEDPTQGRATDAGRKGIFVETVRKNLPTTLRH